VGGGTIEEEVKVTRIDLYRGAGRHPYSMSSPWPPL